EITASAQGMRDKTLKNDLPSNHLEIVGTGGDESYSFNISMASAFVLAAAGVPVTKHGNKSVSSKCGAADVLEALGAKIKTTPEQAKKVFDKCGFVFLHAQVYHPAMRFAGPVRADLGVRTVFNVLGPLTNPARAEYQLLGVYSHTAVRPLCEVLSKLGTKRVIAVYGEDGMDEVSVSDKTYCCEYKDGEYKEY
ncbi:MAG: anthranilate phosphoribosyltransferase, partial [Clostridia bacterium]|nr:anthranilate phosphoribosyltransferase [Clostridia bacterium]